jgi:hypothetical protein
MHSFSAEDRLLRRKSLIFFLIGREPTLFFILVQRAASGLFMVAGVVTIVSFAFSHQFSVN